MSDKEFSKILIVDDLPENLQALEALLRHDQRAIHQASSGEAALTLLLEHEFALAILDVQMPGMNGFETARLIRERRRSRHTPIIFVTAHQREDEDVREAYALGAVDFLWKPFAPEVLRAKVTVFVTLQQRTAEVAQQAALLREHERREHKRALEEERERWEQSALRKQMEEMAEADRAKDEFMAMLAHELCNPLAPILTGLELMKMKLAGMGDVDPLVMRARDTAERQVRHLTRLVDDLLDISRITSGKIALRKAKVVLTDLVEQAVSSVQPLLDQRQHRLDVQLPEERVELHADAVRLTQVLSNLLTNAARYTEPGGAMRLHCERKESALEIHVIDNGRGIASEMLPRIFEPFVQAHGSEAGGLGLGLALVKRLIDMHQGTVTAHSEGPGRGSDFVVRLPLEATSNGSSARSTSGRATPESSQAVQIPANALSIVVIEDNDDLRDTVCLLLTMLGHTVDAANTGERGVDVILEKRPDVALVDIGLPGIDGYEVARRIRAQLPRGEVHLIAMTGFGQANDRQRSHDAGFDAHLAKPADADILQNALAAVGRDPVS